MMLNKDDAQKFYLFHKISFFSAWLGIRKNNEVCSLEPVLSIHDIFGFHLMDG